jgi:hypothetical protein
VQTKDKSIYVDGENQGVIVDQNIKRYGIMKFTGGAVGFVQQQASTQPIFIGRWTGIDIHANSHVKDMTFNSTTGDVGIGISSFQPSAKLEVQSTTSGFLPPRMTTAQRNAILSPVAGLIIYNNDDSALHLYRGTGHGYKPILTDSTLRPVTFLAPLKVTTTAGGIGLPRLTDSEMNAIASPTAGETIWNTSCNCTATYNGTFWQTVRTSTMPSNVSFVSTATAAAVSGLSVAITAGTWIIEVKTHTNILSSGGGWRYAFTFPLNDNGGSVSLGTLRMGTTSVPVTGATGTATGSFTTTGDSNGGMDARFTLKTSASGNVIVLAAQQSSNAFTNTIFAGSIITATRIL